MNNEEQQFLNHLDSRLCNAADRLRSNVNPSDYKPDDIAKVARSSLAWQRGTGYADEAGFFRAVALADIRKADYVLTPGRYVGATAQADDCKTFEYKMARLTAALSEQFKEGARLEAAIRSNLAGLGYDI